MKLNKVYEDAGISAKTGNKRPAFDELLQDIKDKKCNTIVVLKLDSLTKNIYDMEQTMNFLDENDAYLDCTNDDINIVLKKNEDNLRENSNEVRNLKKKIKTRNDRIEELEYDLNDANDIIYELEDKVSKHTKYWEACLSCLDNMGLVSSPYEMNILY